MSAARQTALGVFVVGGLLLFAAGLFWIGDRRQLFDESVELYTEFANVSGLTRGAKVRVSGLDAGEVLEIQIPSAPESPFRVRFRTLSRFQPILRGDSIASIQNDGLVGNKFLQVEAGTNSGIPIVAGATIPSRETIEISDLLAQANQTIMTANSAVMDIQEGINQTVSSVLDLNRETSEVINEVGGQVERFTITGNQIAGRVDAMIDDVRQGKGSVGRLLTDDSIFNQLSAMVDEGHRAVGKFNAAADNFQGVTDDLNGVTADFRALNVPAKVDNVVKTADQLVGEALNAVRALQGPEDSDGGLMAQVRQTLMNANETMSDFSEDAEALKRNWFFRGFFNNRGFFDFDAVTVAEYRQGNILSDRQKISQWIDSPGLFSPDKDGKELLTPDGRNRLDLAMATFLAYSKDDPLVIESWAGSGTDAPVVLQARERAILVRDYLMRRFSLKSSNVAVMPMNAIPATDGQSRNGIGLVLFAPKNKR